MKGGIAIMLGLFVLAVAIAFHALPSRYQLRFLGIDPITYEDGTNRYQILRAASDGTTVWRIDQQTGRTCLIYFLSSGVVDSDPDLCVD